MFYPLVPLERSLDGSMFRELPPLDVHVLFNELSRAGVPDDRLRTICEQLESGATVDLAPALRAAGMLNMSAWLRPATAALAVSMDRIRLILGMDRGS